MIILDIIRSKYAKRIFRKRIPNCFEPNNGFIGSWFSFFIVNAWLLSKLNSLIAAVVLYVLYIWLVIINNIMKVTVKGNELTIKRGTKTQKFDIASCGFKAIENTSGGETSCELIITEANGKQHYIDFELIGVRQFEELLDDLGFNEAQNEVQKLETKKKGE